MFNCSRCEKKFNQRKGTSNWCPDCWRKYNLDYYKRNQVASLAKAARYRDSHREKINQYAKEQRDSLRIETFNQYGGLFCCCCKESNIKFLTLDHTNGGGVKHRKILKGIGGVVFYKWLKQQNWPTGYQVLCYNCNCGKAYNHGVCPHNN